LVGKRNLRGKIQDEGCWETEAGMRHARCGNDIPERCLPVEQDIGGDHCQYGFEELLPL